MLRLGQQLHTFSFKYSGQDFLDRKVVVGINQFQNYHDYGKLDSIDHINLDGWGLESVPQEIFELKNLKSLSLKYNQLTEIPENISNLKTMKHIYLDNNFLNPSLNRLVTFYH